MSMINQAAIEQMNIEEEHDYSITCKNGHHVHGQSDSSQIVQHQSGTGSFKEG